MRSILLAPILLTGLASCSPRHDQGDALACSMKNNYCVPFVGCVRDRNETILGSTHGRHEGPVEAGTSSGAICTGEWRRTADTHGEARFDCSDGRKGYITFSYFDPKSGTLAGEGAFEGWDSPILVWAGYKMADYFEANSDKKDVMAACGDLEQLTSGAMAAGL